MSYNDWKDKTVSFKKIDVRGVQGNFFPGLKMQAAKMAVGEGMEIIQSFEPIPLYEVLEDLGFEHYTEKVAEAEYHTYFYRTQMKQAEKDIPMRPYALTNMALIDDDLAQTAVNFWDLTWNDSRRHLPYETRLLLSLANAVGAGRMRQATRELNCWPGTKASVISVRKSGLPRCFKPIRPSNRWRRKATAAPKSSRC